MKRISIIFIIIFLSACADDEPSNGIAPPSTESPKNALKRTVEVSNGNFNLSNRTDYLYENNLLKQLNYYQSNILNDSTLFEYDRKNRLAYAFDRKFGGTIPDTSKVYIYNSKDQLSEILKIEEDTISSTIKLVYRNQKIVSFSRVLSSSITFNIKVNTDANGNFIEEEVIAANGDTIRSKFTYDNSPNPFYLVNQRFLNPYSFLSPNNVKSIKYYVNNQFSHQEIFELFYDGKGRLDSIYTVDPSFGSTRATKLYY